MGRSNVIIVGSVVLGPLLLGIEAYVLFKAHHRRVRTAELTESIEVSAALLPGTPAVQSPPLPISVERPLPAAPTPAPAAAVEVAPGTETVSNP